MALDVQQGVALVVVLSQEQHRCPSTEVHRRPDRRGLRVDEEVGCPREGQEEDPGPTHRHLNPEGERLEGVGHHWRLPHEEGGATNEARASPVHNGARGVIRWDTICRGGTLPLRSHVAH